jgi:alpha-1,6-mannosyltransferase
MKTLHLTNAWHRSSGGIGTFYKALFETANRQGHRMSLVVPGPDTRVEPVGEFGLIYQLQARLAPLDRSYRIICPHRYLFPRTAIQRIINDERPDLIEIAEKYTMPWLGGLVRTRRLPGVSVRPVVVGASHERMDENVAAYLSDSPLAAHLCQLYMKWLYFPMFDHHITFSEHTAEELIRASDGHKVRRGIWITPMGVDCDRFNFHGRDADDRAVTRLLYAGRLAPEKNVFLLLDMMKRLDPDEYRLTIVGDGPLLDEMRRRNMEHVSFAGYIADRDELAGIYAKADVFVHPNPREPFGIAPLEAMAAGLALIAPNTGGIISYANQTNAWLVSADPDSMAAAAREIRANPAVRGAKILAARQTAEQFDWPVVTNRLLQLYEEITAITRDRRLQPRLSPRTWSRETNCSQNV